MIDYSGRFRSLVRHRHGLTRITLIEYPGPDDWMAVKRRALITAGKRPRNSPDSEWIERMLDCRHSPIRRAMYSFEIEDIPSNTATHFARHVHAQPYVSTLRTDRTPPEYIKQAVDDLTKAVDGDLVVARHTLMDLHRIGHFLVHSDSLASISQIIGGIGRQVCAQGIAFGKRCRQGVYQHRDPDGDHDQRCQQQVQPP